MQTRMTDAEQPTLIPYPTVAHLNRLRRIEGQVRGVHRMVEEGRSCLDIVTQLQAIAAAANSVADQMLDERIRELTHEVAGTQESDQKVDALMQLLDRARRR